MAANDNDKSVAASARARMSRLYTYSQHQLDRLVSPSTREDAINSISAFASKRPLLSLLIAANLFLALLPTLFFASFLLTAIAVAFLAAIAFILFWTGIALLFFVPTLFLTAGLSVLLWVWAVGTYIVGRTIYNRLPFRLHVTGDKQVIFQRAAPGDSNDGFDAIKAEANGARE